MGLQHGVDALNAFPGSEASSQERLFSREVARFNELKSKAFGNPTITNAGIPLDSFGGAFEE